MNRVIFQCEDSMEGILTGVYDAWASRVGHDRVKLEAGPDHEMELFSEYRRVETDGEKAEKVAGTIRRRMGQNCWESIYQATLAEEKEKAEAVYRSVVLGLSLAQRKNGSVYRLMENIQEPCIFQVMTLSRTVAREAHRYLGFVRFQEMKGKLLYSEIEPFGQILPPMETICTVILGAFPDFRQASSDESSSSAGSSLVSFQRGSAEDGASGAVGRGKSL